MKKSILSLFTLALLLTSCGGENHDTETTETTADSTVIAEPVCTYSYNPESTTIGWTAYKFNEKAAVGGTFDELEISSTGSDASVLDIVAGASFKVNTSSVNSNNPDRDQKLVASFFEVLNTPAIVGNIVSAADGAGMVVVTLNEIEKEVAFTYTLEEEVFNMNFEINLEDFNGQDAVASLNEVCNDLHKGADGVSKLWPDVSVTLETTFTKTCE